MRIFEILLDVIKAQMNVGRYLDYSPLTRSPHVAENQAADGHVHEISGLWQIMNKARTGAAGARRVLPLLAGSCFLLLASAVGVAAIMGGSLLFPHISLLKITLFALTPAMLCGGAGAHIFGNYCLYALSGLNDQERRSLALHLPWNKNPEGWPKFFRRWLYCGDWLVDNHSGDAMPYVRAFVTGQAPQTLEAELEIWSEFFHNSNHICRMEAGHSIRELACVESLPVWAKEITPGMNLPDLEKTLGPAGHNWGVNLLKRAAARKKVFNRVDFGGSLNEARFEFHYCLFASGREGLMIIIRPQASAAAEYEDTFSDIAA